MEQKQKPSNKLTVLSEWGSLWKMVLCNKANQVSQTVLGILSKILITNGQEFFNGSQSFSW